MRRKLALLTTSTALALTAATLMAGPAQARNLGGDQPSADICVLPGHATYGSPNSGLPCICVVLPNGHLARSVGKGPNVACPPGTVTLP